MCLLGYVYCYNTASRSFFTATKFSSKKVNLYSKPTTTTDNDELFGEEVPLTTPLIPMTNDEIEDEILELDMPAVSDSEALVAKKSKMYWTSLETEALLTAFKDELQLCLLSQKKIPTKCIRSKIYLDSLTDVINKYSMQQIKEKLWALVRNKTSL